MLARLTIVSFLSLLTFHSPAGATNSSCGYNEKDQSAFVQIVTPTSMRLFVTNAGEIKWSDPMSSQVFDCGKATVMNVDSIGVNDFNSVQASLFILDLQRPFGGGLTPETVGISEIEFSIDGGTGEDSLEIHGGDPANRIVFGEEGVNLNKDSDVDATLDDLEDISILGEGRNDVLSGGGGSGTGGPFAMRLLVYGLAGNDSLVGSNAGDTMLGSDGNDTMSGGRGGDVIFGNKGADNLSGGAGGDELDGFQGNDRLRGNSGPDNLEGGGGTDDCEGGPGTDTVSGCELP
jgi:Ca2+-binding RTX toxin-like protein